MFVLAFHFVLWFGLVWFFCWFVVDVSGVFLCDYEIGDLQKSRRQISLPSNILERTMQYVNFLPEKKFQ